MPGAGRPRAPLSYDDAARYLRSLELFGMRFGLERMRRLMTALGAPHERFRAVQVVGTNGKSSTVRMTAALLERHGLHCGAYTSPHIGSFSERIEVRGKPLSDERFAAAVERAARAARLVERGLPDGEHVTQFEALTAAAFSALGQADLDAVVVEAGLGGRYDATSVVRPRVLVLTNVGLEHTRWLGPTERHIAEEKLAVLPPGGTLVAGALGPEALAVAQRTAAERDARFLLEGRDVVVEEAASGGFPGRFSVHTPRGRYDPIELRALGAFQRPNFALAVSAAEEFLSTERELDPDLVRAVARDLLLPGRLEAVEDEPLVLLDGAHNPSAARALGPSLEQVVAGRRLVVVVSVLDDKDAAGILSELLPLSAHVVFTRSSHPRALSPATLESLARQLGGPPGEIVQDPGVALERARAEAGPAGAVIVTGSIYLLSDLVATTTAGASEVA